MEELQTDQFTVMIAPPVTSYGPVEGRKYTLSTSDTDNSRHLTIGTKYNVSIYKTFEDIFTAEWISKLGEYVFSGRIYISGGEYDEKQAQTRFNHIHSLLPEMIFHIIKSDFELFKHVPWLLDAPIIIEYVSNFHQLRTVKNYGTPRKYLTLQN
ncbi:hypothetical protein KHA93_05850 [Bacillus sp. FJAT-49732]|uniref:Staygreen protein domain-containing protein n=1 Tax=Lederbergia citrisecunda TaxID=2833583 RepID=A0A942TNF9_9BACI|nr:staygreen family protein [Lederbergia citrisecunda]MBS4199177.1 hypothetical protein [Lederbergia citrisecunda]